MKSQRICTVCGEAASGRSPYPDLCLFHRIERDDGVAAARRLVPDHPYAKGTPPPPSQPIRSYTVEFSMDVRDASPRRAAEQVMRYLREFIVDPDPRMLSMQVIAEDETETDMAISNRAL